MDTALVLARLLLAAVFAIAGFAKLADREGSRRGLEGFGVPAAAAQPASVLLPLAEIAVAILLLPVATAWWGGIGALLLLGLFVGGIAYQMTKGNHPDCHCFGQLHSEPAGLSTLIRNGVLGAVAAYLVVFGRDWFSFSNEDAGHSLVAWIGNLSTWELVASILGLIAVAAIAIEGWLLIHLLGQNGRVLLRLDSLETVGSGALAAEPIAAAGAVQPKPMGLPEGSPAPSFRLEGVFGETMTLDALRAQGKPVMLIFSDPTCGPCNALLPDIGKWQRDHSSRLTVAVVSRGAAEANRSKVTEHGLSHVFLQKDREVAQSFEANGTPAAVLVLADGTIGSPVAPGAEAIRGLFAKATGTLPLQPAAVQRPTGNGQNGGRMPSADSAIPAPAVAKVGQPAPAVTLPDLQGNTVNLSDFKGDPTLLLFWNPGCGFCKRMTDELKQWEAKPPKGAPKLLVVSTGTPEANLEMGLSSTTVLDQGFSIGRAYGASGTPSAVLVDAKGNVASEVAVGQPGVMALATGKDPKTVGNGAAPGPEVKTAKKGEKAPVVKLKDLEGVSFDLAKQTTDTLLVFWNPGCGFCRRMVDDLKAWETAPPAGSPKAVFVSSGSVEANKEFGLTSTILLDEGFAVGRLFGASGTPSAVLVDKSGKVKSDIAVGAPGVLELAGAAPVQGQTA